MCLFYLSPQLFSSWTVTAAVFPLIDAVLREETFLTLYKIRHCCLNLLQGILYQQVLSFMIASPLMHTHIHAHKHTQVTTNPSKEVWHAFVRTFFCQQGAGNSMQRRLPLLCESFVSLHPQAPPLSQPALQWESLQVLTLSGGGQSQVRDLLLGYHQISG